jgi:hypothetical protein
VPTPASATATFGLLDPLGPGATRRLILAGTTLPLASPGTGGDLLPACDPFVDAALPYFRHVLSTRLSTAYAAAMAGQALATTNKACVETCPMDPGPYLGTNALRLPLLALYPVSGRESERTMHTAKIEALYRVVYLLPALSFEQAKRVAPILTAAVKLLFLAIEEGGVADYESGTRVWEDASVSAVRMVEHRIGPAADAEDTRMAHYALTADLSVEMLEAYDSATGNPFWGSSIQLDLADDQGADLESFVRARADL